MSASEYKARASFARAHMYTERPGMDTQKSLIRTFLWWAGTAFITWAIIVGIGYLLVTRL